MVAHLLDPSDDDGTTLLQFVFEVFLLLLAGGINLEGESSSQQFTSRPIRLSILILGASANCTLFVDIISEGHQREADISTLSNIYRNLNQIKREKIIKIQNCSVKTYYYIHRSDRVSQSFAALTSA